MEVDNEDYDEGQPNEICSACSRHYDYIDFDYQSCSKCGWDDERKKWGKRTEPTRENYLNGDADILTGQWNY